MQNYNNLKEEKLIVKEIDPAIIELQKKDGKAPAILNFNKDRYCEDWFFKVNKAFENNLDIRISKITKKGELSQVKRTQGVNIYLESGYQFSTMICKESFREFLNIPDNRIIQIHFCNGDFVRFTLYKANKKKNRIDIMGYFICNNIEFLHILKNGIDEEANKNNFIKDSM